MEAGAAPGLARGISPAVVSGEVEGSATEAEARYQALIVLADRFRALGPFFCHLPLFRLPGSLSSALSMRNRHDAVTPRCRSHSDAGATQILGHGPLASGQLQRSAMARGPTRRRRWP